MAAANSGDVDACAIAVIALRDTAPTHLASAGPLMHLPPSDIVAHVADLLLHAVVLDLAGMPVVAEIQRTRAAIVRKEFSL